MFTLPYLKSFTSENECTKANKPTVIVLIAAEILVAAVNIVVDLYAGE